MNITYVVPTIVVIAFIGSVILAYLEDKNE